MKIKFENGSVLESIESYDCKRSKRAIYFYGVKLHWYQKIWIEFNVFVEKWRKLWRR